MTEPDHALILRQLGTLPQVSRGGQPQRGPPTSFSPVTPSNTALGDVPLSTTRDCTLSLLGRMCLSDNELPF